MTRTEIELALYLVGAVAAFSWLASLLFQIRRNAQAMHRRSEAQAAMDAMDYTTVTTSSTPAFGLMTLHQQELQRLEQRKLKLIVGASSRIH